MGRGRRNGSRVGVMGVESGWGAEGVERRLLVEGRGARPRDGEGARGGR